MSDQEPQEQQTTEQSADAPTRSSPPGGPRRSSGGSRGYPRGERRGRYVPRPKVCHFCVDKVKKIDYKQSDMLRRFLSDRGKIRPRRQTGTCARHQRHLALAIKRARHLALLPFVSSQAR